MDAMLAIVLLLHLSTMWGSGAANVPQLRRQKRDWLIPTQKLKENVDYSERGYVARIRSDKNGGKNLFYSLQGQGASQPPVNLFVVDENTGLVYVRGKLDREKKETYIVRGWVRFPNGTVAEEGIDLRFDVDDENDNPPVFARVPPAAVKESSPPGTLVAVVTATDADKANCSHSKIAYSILKQEPSDGRDLFYINRYNGSIYVKENTLDREKQSLYNLTIKGTDMGGAPGGNTGTGTILIKVADINDNKPVLEKDEYSGSIMENTAKKEVMRFKALDADEEKTDNWLAVFHIVSGNENGTFSIKTDPKTNEGVLMLEKPVDFEENPDINLGVVVSNVAPYPWGDDGDGGWSSGTGGTAKNPGNKKKPIKGKVYPVSITVENEPEGITFKPSTKPVAVSEDPKKNTLMKVIAVFAASDADSGKPAENVRYAKGYDPDNWLLIDPETAEIKLQKYPDRESPFLVNGTYYAKILSMTHDLPVKMVTGTIALQVGDVNDNCPSLTSNMKAVCSDTQIINVTAVDVDGDPNAAPFNFSIVTEKSQGEWRLEPLNDTSVSLRALKPLWPGRYKVVFIIKDKQGLACPDPQYLNLHVCSCEGGETCKAARSQSQGAIVKKSTSKFAGLGVGALILGFLALLLAGLLLMSCSCGHMSGSFSELPFETKDHLIVYHTEGRGEDKDVPLLSSPVQMSPAVISAAQANKVASKANPNTTAAFMPLNMGTAQIGFEPTRMQQSSFEEYGESWREMYAMAEQYDCLDDIALPDMFLHEYYTQKASCAAEMQTSRDCLLEYDFEGQGSSAGSVGSCSLVGSDHDLQFLNDLGPKFKTLSDICSPPRPPTPPTRQSIVIPVVDKVDHISGPKLETAKPPSIHGESTECNQNVSISQSSTSVMGFNGAASSSMHRQASLSNSSMAQSCHVSPATRAMLPPAGQVLLLQQQQPLYYAASPMLQPMPYVVQPQLQSTVLLAEPPVANLQGMILLNGMSGHAEHVMQGGKTAGTVALVRRTGNGVVEMNQGMGTWVRSDGQGEVMGVRRNGRRIKSEGGGKAEYSNIQTVIGTHIDAGATGTEEVQTRLRSDAQGEVMGVRRNGQWIQSESGGRAEYGNIQTIIGVHIDAGATGTEKVQMDQGMGTWVRSDGQGEAMGVRRNGRRIKSEGGGRAEYSNIQTMIGAHVDAGATGTEKVQMNQGKRTRLRSDGQGEVMGVRRNSQQIKSESGGRAEFSTVETMIGAHTDAGATGAEQGQIGNKTRTRSTASADTGFMGFIQNTFSSNIEHQ
ncbi:desmoglein-1-like [Chelmon rostratus]|uniref:desmoglein-1-like n=1 Tax=Chelmon rostratus TaxID=109905 RepID=UPI001BEA2293|nr:desmoglein-1-like [Chelmon rostratus]